MKDFQDDFYEDNEEINKHTEENSKNDISHHQALREGISENAEGAEPIFRTDEEKDERSEKKTEANTSEGQGCEEEICSAEKTADSASEAKINQENAQTDYSCSYKPPYYVPDFTVVNSAHQEENKKKNGLKMWTVALSAIVLLFALLGVVFIGLQLKNNQDRNNGEGASADSDAQSLTVVKNESPIQVNVEIDESTLSALSLEQVVEQVADTVVEIVTTQVQTGQFGYGQYVTSGAGSGVLIDKDGRGFIITNQHVIGDQPEQTTITVRLTNGSEYEAKYIAGDESSDIAILKIDATDLPYAVMGSSEKLNVGQSVVAIGNPLGELGGTVTNGIISAKDRQVIVDGNRMTLLQTNAAINPGNSGGGLFDMAGRLIGIVNAKQSATGIEGLGFAIPIDVAWAVASDLIQYGYVTDRLTLPFDAEYWDDLTLSYPLWGTISMPNGVYIAQSRLSDLKQYDLILEINGKTIDTLSDYYSAIDQIEKGDTVSMVVGRLVGKKEMDEHTVEFVAQFSEKPGA